MNLLKRLLRFQIRNAPMVFLPTGIALVLLALVLFAVERNFVLHAQHATGTISSMQSKVDSDGDENFYPHFKFVTNEGTRMEISSNVGTNPPSFEIGQQVPILYAPNRPETARIATTFQLYGVSIILEIVGAFFVAAGFLMKYLRQKYFPV